MDRESFERLMEAGDLGDPVHPVPEWDKPIPFSDPNTPDFPVESLSGAVGAFVEQLAESTQAPEEMSGILSLGILAAAFRSKYEVEIAPDWREPLCLHPVAVAPPGERKSAVISALSGPVYEYEAEQRGFEAAEIAQDQTERVLLERALQAAQNSAAKGNGDFEAKRQEVLDLPAQLANFKGLHPFRLMVDDTTPEKLVDMVEMQGGSITLASDESIEDARYLWRRIAASGEAEISRRDLFRLVRGKFKKAEGMEAPLRVLVEYGHTRIEDVEWDGAGRKASSQIKVDPLTNGRNGQNGRN